MSLSKWKREKNFRALEKGYNRFPEYFPYLFLLKRLKDEVKELEIAIKQNIKIGILTECADVSNIVDYIYAKRVEDIPTTLRLIKDKG